MQVVYSPTSPLLKDLQMEYSNKTVKFAGIEVPPDLKKRNFFFLYFNTLIIGIILAMPNIVQPAFLHEIIKVSDDIFGFTNGFMQSTSQIATLAFVGVVGVLSDKVGRKILVLIGFGIIVISFYLLGMAVEISSFLNIQPEAASKICAYLSFAPHRAADFVDFAPDLIVAYFLRFFLGVGMILCYPQFITMVADYTYSKDRGKGMAANGIMMGLAAILVFSIIAPIGREMGVEFLFVLSSIIALLGIVFTWCFLRDRLPENKKENKKNIKEIIGAVKKSTALKVSYLGTLIGRADGAIMTTYIIVWAVHEGQKVGMTSGEATQKGAIPLIIMSVLALASFPLVGILLDKWGRIQTLILTFFVGGIGFLLVAISPSPFSGFIFVALVLVAFGLTGSVAATTIASDVAPKKIVGSILGGLNTMQPIGFIFFYQACGYIFDLKGAVGAFAIKGIANIILVVYFLFVKKDILEEIKTRPKT